MWLWIRMRIKRVLMEVRTTTKQGSMEVRMGIKRGLI